VTGGGGPKFIVKDNVSGSVARTEAGFIAHTARPRKDPELRRTMATAARPSSIRYVKATLSR
jgi:hypothetical protein